MHTVKELGIKRNGTGNCGVHVRNFTFYTQELGSLHGNTIIHMNILSAKFKFWTKVVFGLCFRKKKSGQVKIAGWNYPHRTIVLPICILYVSCVCVCPIWNIANVPFLCFAIFFFLLFLYQYTCIYICVLFNLMPFITLHIVFGIVYEYMCRKV